MSTPWQMLIGNLAVVALFVLTWAHARYWLRNQAGRTRSIVFGIFMGGGIVATMVMSAELEPGRLIDLRASLLALASFFGGPVAGTISAIMALGARFWLAGHGAVAGAIAILAVTLTGLLLRKATHNHALTPRHMMLLGAAVALVNVTITMASRSPESWLDVLIGFAGPVALLNFTATALSGMVFIQARRLSAERDLLAAALAQAPDYAYVKDRHSRFAAVNTAVAKLHGFQDATDILGKTDFDIANPDRAAKLIQQEKAILISGQPLLDFEEQLSDPEGKLRWFSTSKVPLQDGTGRIIGIAGVTRDITDEKALRKALTESRDLLSHALAEMSDGLAMYDRQDRLVFCNEQYLASFPRTASVRKPGAHFRDILKAVVRTGEQTTVPALNQDEWVERMLNTLHKESEEEIALFDGRWLQVRTRPTRNGSTLAVVSDITRIKHAELALHSATDQLKHLVRTDGLTDLLNRRAFDDAIDGEVRRSARAGTPLSLLLIDVDRFKAYNDHYGHPAGDQILRRVSALLKASLKRPGDIAARYGGEEFAAILPETDEDGAWLVAEAFRKAVADARIPHAASERGHVTASIGVATYAPDNLSRSTEELLAAADEALYGAKAAGRDRVLGTRVASKEKRYAQR